MESVWEVATIALGVLLVLSESLPFVKQTSANGLLDTVIGLVKKGKSIRDALDTPSPLETV